MHTAPLVKWCAVFPWKPDHVVSLLQSLHWLNDRSRVNWKLNSLPHVLKRLSSLHIPAVDHTHMIKSKTKTGQGCFSFSGPARPATSLNQVPKRYFSKTIYACNLGDPFPLRSLSRQLLQDYHNKYLPSCRTQYRQMSFFPRTIQDRNGLPQEVNSWFTGLF